MSVKLSLYDFFAHMIPGVGYVILLILGLTTFEIIKLDFSSWQSLSLQTLLPLVGAYVLGHLLDSVAYFYTKLFIKGHSTARKNVWQYFQYVHPYINLKAKPKDWSLMMFAIKDKDHELFQDIESHNAMHIMFRNLTLIFTLSALLFTAFFFAFGNVWNLVAAAASIPLAYSALQRTEMRRTWFYTNILRAYSALFLPEDMLSKQFIELKSPDNKQPIAQKEAPAANDSKPINTA